MLPLTVRRAFVHACLTLGVLLSVLPTLADTPAKPTVQVSTAQAIVLQHVIPGDIVKMLHWEKPSALPIGVSQIVAVPGQNALLVTGTPDGLAKVRQIVKLVDIEPRQVQITFAMAHASETDLNASGIDFDLVPLMPPSQKMYQVYASGDLAAKLLQTLTAQRAVTLTQFLNTANNVHSSLRADSVELAVTPRVNSDNTVTLALSSAFTVVTVKHPFNTLRTVKNGDTFVIGLHYADPQTGEENSLLFVTPTLK